MAMLNKRKVLIALIDFQIKYTSDKDVADSKIFVEEISYYYKKLGLYDRIIDSINLGKVGLT